MGTPSTRHAIVTADELDALLGTVTAPRLDLTKVTGMLSEAAVCELATESTGNTAHTVRGLIEGVILRHGGTLDRAALAALHAVAYYHVPKLQERMEAMGGGTCAD